MLPEAEDVEVQVDQNDLEIDVYRSSGPGGQSVNTTDSAVRITHKPTGIVVSMQDEKSQLQNRERAMKVLRARLYEQKLAEQQAELAADRRAQVGTGERAEKIRTYNFPERRVTDHRIKLTVHNLDQLLSGELDDVTRRCRTTRSAAGSTPPRALTVAPSGDGVRRPHSSSPGARPITVKPPDPSRHGHSPLSPPAPSTSPASPATLRGRHRPASPAGPRPRGSPRSSARPGPAT